MVFTIYIFIDSASSFYDAKKIKMLIFYFITLFAALPVMAYVLAANTKNKGMVFGGSVIVLTFCIIIYLSKFSIIGSLQNQLINNKIFDEIYLDSKISNEFLKKIEDNLNEQQVKDWLIRYISKSIDLKKLNSAESLITYSEKFFSSNEEKLVFYELYTVLRDAKFPEFINSEFAINFNSTSPCFVKSGEVKLFIMNGPDIPIASKKFTTIEDLSLKNSDSIIPGFDLASAHLNRETLEFSVDIICSDNSNYYLKNLFVLNEDSSFNSYKIESNEWLKISQEL